MNDDYARLQEWLKIKGSDSTSLEQLSKNCNPLERLELEERIRFLLNRTGDPTCVNRPKSES